MNAAERVPSPSRFWIALGARRAARKTSAWGPTPKKWANVYSRTRPMTREEKIPRATRAAPPRPAGWAAAGGIGSGAVDGSGDVGRIGSLMEAALYARPYNLALS